MSNLKERLQEAGDASAMAELEGRTFQILSFKMGERDSNFSEGTYLYADTQLLVEEEAGIVETSVELSGARICRQLQVLKDDDLPLRVKLVRRLDLKGVPWDLQAVDGDEDSPVTAAAKAAGAKEKTRKKTDPLAEFRDDAGKLKLSAFVVWWQEQKLGPDQLAEVVGANTDQALEHWFMVDKHRGLDDLVQAAKLKGGPAEDLPFT